jgi:hypothetical protein
MNLASRLIALCFIALGVFLMSGDATVVDRRMGLGGVLFGGAVWLIEGGLRAHEKDVARGRAWRATTGRSEFGPVRGRLLMFAAACACMAATPALIDNHILGAAFLALGTVPLLAALILAAWALDPRPLVVINAQGLFDRRVMKRMIPWSAVTGLDLDNGRLAGLTVTCAQADDLRRVGVWGEAGRYPDGFLIGDMLLDGDGAEMFAAAKRYRRKTNDISDHAVIG